MSDEELKKVANEVRKGIVTGVHAAKSGHPGGSLGAADIMTYLYFEEMNVDPADPRKADRDRFVLSKGHCAPGLYAVLAERGFFPKEDLETLRHIGSHLQGHPNMNDTPGVDMSTGSLGQGLACGVGMAIAANKVKGIRACCCSDTFSARMTRAHNDANILTFGERVVGQGLAMELVDAFLTTEFEGGRHQRRVDLITKLEQEENS